MPWKVQFRAGGTVVPATCRTAFGTRVATPAAAGNLYVKRADDRRVIRRPFHAPRLTIDSAGVAALGQRRRGQQQIDAQSVISLERAGAIVPPAIGSRRLLESAKHVDESEAEQRLQRLALLGLTRTQPTHAAGSCTSRSSGAMLKSPSTSSRTCAASSWRNQWRTARSHPSLYRNLSEPTLCPLGTYRLITRRPPPTVAASTRRWGSS